MAVAVCFTLSPSLCQSVYVSPALCFHISNSESEMKININNYCKGKAQHASITITNKSRA